MDCSWAEGRRRRCRGGGGLRYDEGNTQFTLEIKSKSGILNFADTTATASKRGGVGELEGLCQLPSVG